MPTGPALTPWNWLLAASPILVLVLAILWQQWSAPRAGATAFLLALVLAWLPFGGDARLLALASAKGLSLSLFVLSIIWTAVFLYNLIERLGAVKVLGKSILSTTSEPAVQALLIAWAFAGFLQGVAGFGVPVAVAAPLLVMAGFPPTLAAASALVGHAWAVTFGSLGSSFYTIQLVTGLPGATLGPHLALLFAVPIVATGFAVAHMVGGFRGMRQHAGTVLAAGGVMALFVWITTSVGAAQIASVVPGLAGCGVIWLLSRRRRAPATATAVADPPTPGSRGERPLTFHLAFLPYYLLILLTVVSQIPAVAKATGNLSWGLNYPAVETALGFKVAAAKAYAKIRLLNHPAPLILASALLTYLVLKAMGRWRPGAAWHALRPTYSQCLGTSLGVATMVMMALVMIDTGMTSVLAQGIAAASGPLFPLFSPFIGVLGTFLTGSNTNSNIMFGALQVETARVLGVSVVTMASVQSIGGSLGSAIAPAKVLVGTTLVGLGGREAEVLRRTIPYCLVLVALVGVEAWLVVYLLR